MDSFLSGPSMQDTDLPASSSRNGDINQQMKSLGLRKLLMEKLPKDMGSISNMQRKVASLESREMLRMADSRRTLPVMLFSVSVEDKVKSLKKSISTLMSCHQMVISQKYLLEETIFIQIGYLLVTNCEECKDLNCVCVCFWIIN